MTGFDAFMDAIPAKAFTPNPDVVDVVNLITTWRRKLRNKRFPLGGRDLLALRKQHLKPACRIVVTADEYRADLMRANDDGYPLVIRDFAAYDFAPVYGLQVLYEIPSQPLWVIDVAQQISECDPSELWIKWPNSEEEILWN